MHKQDKGLTQQGAVWPFCAFERFHWC